MSAGDPFLISGPAIISFSGGRTSAYMLWRILQAHCGELPPDVKVAFANTGREMPATLDFVHECGERWRVPIAWLEYRRTPRERPAKDILWAEEVNHNSASRNGEPFEQMLAGKRFLPNPTMRFCTEETKIRTIKRWVQRTTNWSHWTNVIGLRADEPGRIAKLAKRNASNKERFNAIAPLASAGIEEIDVLAFWRGQPFDLGLKGRWEGNCDGCFLKNRGALSRMCADYPERMQWWADQEAAYRGSTLKPETALFRADREPYATLLQVTRDQGVLPFDLEDATNECDVGCGI